MKTFNKIINESYNSDFELPVDLDVIYLKQLKPIENKDGSKSYKHPLDRNYITIKNPELIVRLESIIKDYKKVLIHTYNLTNEVKNRSITKKEYEDITELLSGLSYLSLMEITKGNIV